MRTIGILSSHSTLEADLVVGTLDELPAGSLQALLRRRIAASSKGPKSMIADLSARHAKLK
jgi:hypothetical protein